MLVYAAALAVVLFMSAGQLLFKASAKRLAETSLLDPGFLALFSVSLVVYGAVSIAWVVILQRVELSRAYPVLALSFVLVPLGAMFFFKEQLSVHYLIGALLIVAGIGYIGLRTQ